VYVRTCIIFALIVALTVPLPAQQPGTPASPLIGESGGLKIVVVQGEDAKNNVRTKVAVPPVVEVQDDAGKPVAGAEVVFQLPMTGPSGVFNGWVKTQTARTDEQGRATVTGYAPNDEEGRFNMKVTAKSGTKTATAVIPQSNVSGSAGSQASSKKSGWWKILAIVGGGALVGGIVAATRGDNGSTAVANPVVITTGPITIGGPR
jgi:hypothetical protein